MTETTTVERFEEMVFDYDFEGLTSFTEGVRDYAHRRFDRLAAIAARLPEDKVLSIWMAKCSKELLHPKHIEWMYAVFRKTMMAERKRLASLVLVPTEDFLYDGTPVVRKPSVIHIVPQDAGREPVGTSRADEHRQAADAALDADNERLRAALKVIVSWLDRDEGSSYDMTGYIDYTTRAIDSLLENKRKFLRKITAQMNDITRAAKNDSEFDEQAWIRLSELKQRVLRSGFMFKDMLDVHHAVRGEVYSHTGLDMRAFRSRAEMQRDADHYRKLKVQIIDADRLVGLTPEQFAVWKQVAYEHPDAVAPGDGGDANPMADGVGGVDALPDEQIAGNARDQRNARERNRRRAALIAREVAGYTRQQAVAVPRTETSANRALAETAARLERELPEKAPKKLDAIAVAAKAMK